MQKQEKGISMTQVMSIFILSAAAPLVRLIPGFAAKTSGAASWLAVPILVIYGIVTVAIVNKLINGLKNKDGTNLKVNNLNDVFSTVFGSGVNKVLSVIYILWLILSVSVQARVFAERFVVTLLIYAPIDFFIISMFIIAYVMSNVRIEAFGRFSQLFAIVFLIVIGAITLTIIKDVNVNNLIPITIYDAKNVFLSGTEIAGLCSFFTYLFFFGEKITDKENINKSKRYGIIAIAFIAFVAIVTTIGVFGHELTSVFTQPFFTSLKYISIFNSVERIESVLIALWVIADVTLVVFLLLCICNLCKNTFKLSSRKVAVAPILLLLYGVVLLIGKSYIYLLNFAAVVIIPLNLFFGIIILIITLITAKWRKLV